MGTVCLKQSDQFHSLVPGDRQILFGVVSATNRFTPNGRHPWHNNTARVGAKNSVFPTLYPPLNWYPSKHVLANIAPGRWLEQLGCVVGCHFQPCQDFTTIGVACFLMSIKEFHGCLGSFPFVLCIYMSFPESTTLRSVRGVISSHFPLEL